MINSKELRLGNWIEFGASQHRCTHFDITNLVTIEIKKNEDKLTQYQPIKLTTKWLRALGFKKPNNWWVIHYGKDSLFEIFAIQRGPSFISSYSTTRIKYVHQLQNLFFAITGQELEREFLTAKCKKCGGSTSEKEHTCAYLSDMHDDKTTLCNCCDACETACAKEV